MSSLIFATELRQNVLSNVVHKAIVYVLPYHNYYSVIKWPCFDLTWHIVWRWLTKWARQPVDRQGVRCVWSPSLGRSVRCHQAARKLVEWGSLRKGSVVTPPQEHTSLRLQPPYFRSPATVQNLRLTSSHTDPLTLQTDSYHAVVHYFFHGSTLCTFYFPTSLMAFFT